MTFPTAEITYHLERDDEEAELTITGEVEPYIPGKISGPPEHCYPAEGGTASIIDILYVPENGTTLDKWPGQLTSEEEDEVEEMLVNQATEDAEEARADAMIEAYLDRHEMDLDRFY